MLNDVLVASLIVSSISFVGALLLFGKKSFGSEMSNYFVSFAAGVMLATAFLDIFPEALAESNNGQDIFLPALVGVVTFFFFEKFIVWFHHHDSTHNLNPTALLILIGDGIHNFFGGIAIAATFLTSPSLGIATTIAIAAHEIPQEIADLSVLINGGMSKTKALFFNFLSALTAVIGAVLGVYFLNSFESVIPIALAFTAGVFIYIACSDLIPNLHHTFKIDKRWEQTVPFILGIILMYVITSVMQG